ncbi:MAG: hypothetical protein M3314_12560 [Actinomycetota bacterium]|nr:hypothetical protein [Actinomycetota bacterium]
MHTRARLGALAWIFVLAAAVGGCGGDDDDSSSNTTRNTRFPPPAEVENRPIQEGEGACGLLSRTEVESVAGVSVNPGDGVATKGGTSSCAYRVRNNTAQYVGVIVQTEGGTNFENTSQALGGAAEPLPGVGERAFVAKDTVYALKGGRLLILTVSTTQPEPARKQAAIRLSQAAIGKV